ncbi:MAG: tRNA pseudouridine(13) synthase TruD [Desulfuromonas sp.]|nr:MAG: tRNA pseudouridine(13) synthase TruD [Desulfuromonas sp.]
MSEHYLTAEIPGTGGTIKETADDFHVEEIPLYQPSGEGEHLYLTVEKKDLTTQQLLRHAAQTFKVQEREIGYAGLKDAKATTIQTISLPLVEPDQAERIETGQISMVSARRHRNKLRPGHLLGNRFQIRIADPEPDALERARTILEILEKRGMPNYFGRQRYGILGNSHLVGRSIMKQDYETGCRLVIGDPELIEHPAWKEAAELFLSGDLQKAVERLPRHCRYERQVITDLIRGRSAKKTLLGLPRNMLRLYLSACQSSLFDRIIDMRLATIDKIWPGDIAYKHQNGACFRVENESAEQQRADSFEISATAPLFGHKTMLARSQSGIIEESLLEKEKLQLGDFKLGRGLDMPGERRPIRIPVSDIEIEMEQKDLLLRFALPKGSFATSLLREVTKSISPHIQ